MPAKPLRPQDPRTLGGYQLTALLGEGGMGAVHLARDPAERLVAVKVVKRWRTHALVPEAAATLVDGAAAPLGAYLGVLGGSGLTAYAGLKRIVALGAGETVFVSSAAGAVGQVAGQLARRWGAERVIGSAGSAAKVSFLIDELGYDAAFDHRAAPVTDQLAAAAPEGIDVYFDNVGGEHLEAALASLRDHGRICACGMLSTYNATDPVPSRCCAATSSARPWCDCPLDGIAGGGTEVGREGETAR